MQISPAYDRPIVSIDQVAGVGAACVRQRRRLLDVLGSLADDQWAAPSRCEDWRVQDVAAHLVGVDGYWRASIAAGLAGTPTRLLDGFDPKATPAMMVAAAATQSPEQTLVELVAATTGLCDLVESLGDDAWAVLAESPAGHVAISDVVHHALWDAWVHERDVMLPLGLTPAEEADEILASLRYVAAISPCFALMAGAARTPAALVLEVTDPSARIVIDVDDTVRVHDGEPVVADPVVLHGRAVDLTESLSARAPLDQDVPGDKRWLVASLAEVFEVSP